MYKDKVTLLVQSTDSFSDCWTPFFTLLHKYWPSCPYRILLNTETKDFSASGFNVESTKALKIAGGKWPTWSESLLLALNLVQTPLVLLILDDFFPSGPVDEIAIDTAVGKMLEHDYSHITLTEYGLQRPSLPSADPFLLSIKQNAKYRVSTSPALWKVASLVSYVRPKENAWQFEIFGSIRAKKRKDTFFAVNPHHAKNGKEGVVPYFYGTLNTGIVKGKWQKEIPQFFESNGITVDCTIRGFYSPLPGIISKYHTLKKLLQEPIVTFKGLLGI